MIKALFIALLFLVLSAFIQPLLPTFDHIANSRILPIIACAAVLVLFFGYTQGLIFAFLAGFLHDTAHVINYYIAVPDIIEQPVEHLKFGYSIILLGIVTLLTKILQNLIKLRGLLPALIWIGGFITAYLFLELLLIAFVRGSFPQGELWLEQIAYTVTFTSLTAFLTFTLFHLCLRLLNIKDFHFLKLNRFISLHTESQ